MCSETQQILQWRPLNVAKSTSNRPDDIFHISTTPFNVSSPPLNVTTFSHFLFIFDVSQCADCFFLVSQLKSKCSKCRKGCYVDFSKHLVLNSLISFCPPLCAMHVRERFQSIIICNISKCKNDHISERNTPLAKTFAASHLSCAQDKL